MHGAVIGPSTAHGLGPSTPHYLGHQAPHCRTPLPPLLLLPHAQESCPQPRYLLHPPPLGHPPLQTPTATQDPPVWLSWAPPAEHSPGMGPCEAPAPPLAGWGGRLRTHPHPRGALSSLPPAPPPREARGWDARGVFRWWYKSEQTNRKKKKEQTPHPKNNDQKKKRKLSLIKSKIGTFTNPSGSCLDQVNVKYKKKKRKKKSPPPPPEIIKK